MCKDNKEKENKSEWHIGLGVCVIVLLICFAVAGIVLLYFLGGTCKPFPLPFLKFLAIETCVAICAVTVVTICIIICRTVIYVCEMRANKNNSIKELDDQFLEKVYGIACSEKEKSPQIINKKQKKYNVINNIFKFY